MLEALTRLFSAPKATPAPHDPKLAVAALLVHLAAVDGSFSKQEREAVRSTLIEHYGLDGGDVDTLIVHAQRADAEAVDFYKFTSNLSHLDEGERIEIVRMMWQVVFADGRNHEMEDNMVWRIAELIGVSARDRTVLRNEIGQGVGGA
jgi:uncharacterized tellurite resistance protein B-like protein